MAHHHPLGGTVYYRLKWYEYGGKVQYSSIVSVKTTSSAPVKIFGTPDGKVVVQHTVGNLELQMVTSNGQVVAKQTLNTAGQTIIQPSVPKGIYVVTVTGNKKVLQSKKIML